MDRVLWALGLVAMGACHPSGSTGQGPREATKVVRPDGPLDAEQAGRYMLALVNRDRAEQDLPPVEWDEVAALAGTRHAEDMAHRGFTGHWGSDGSVPEQRYTEGGGDQMVQENAACFFDGTERELSTQPMIDPVELETIQAAFMGEVPPNDGHRKNVLKPLHTHLGVGVAQPVGHREICVAQEFVDAYGDYGELPETARPGQSVDVEGEVHPPMEFGGVGIARIPLPEPLTVEQLSQRSTYPVPPPDRLYFPKGYKTPKPVKVEDGRFSISIELGDRSGLCEISVWAKPQGEEELMPVSIRTIVVR